MASLKATTPDNKIFIAPDEPTLITLLKSQGYDNIVLSYQIAGTVVKVEIQP